MTGWNAENLAGSAGAGAVTLLAGTSFCVSAANGDMDQLRPHGMFFRDTRFVSNWALEVTGHPIEALGSPVPRPFPADFVGGPSGTDGLEESNLLIERRRSLFGGVPEEIPIRNFSNKPTYA